MPSVSHVSLAFAQRPLFLGFDVGGTGIKLGVVDDLGRPLAQTRIDTLEDQGPQGAVARARVAVNEMLAGLGLTVAGLLATAFSLSGSAFRALGGWLSDRYGARFVMYLALGAAAAVTFAASYPQTEYIVRGINGDIRFSFGIGLLAGAAVALVPSARTRPGDDHPGKPVTRCSHADWPRGALCRASPWPRRLFAARIAAQD